MHFLKRSCASYTLGTFHRGVVVFIKRRGTVHRGVVLFSARSCTWYCNSYKGGVEKFKVHHVVPWNYKDERRLRERDRVPSTKSRGNY